MEPRPSPERKALDVPQPRERDERNDGLDAGPDDEHTTEPRAALPAEAPAFADVSRRAPLPRRVRARLVRLRPRWRIRPLTGSAVLRRQWRRFALGGVLALLLIGLVAVIVHQLTPEPRFAAVRQGNLMLAYIAPGSVESVVYDVNFTSPGTVTEIDVAVGQQVKAGQTLAKLDTKAAQDALNEAQLAVSNAQTALQDAQASQAGVNAQSAAELAVDDAVRGGRIVPLDGVVDEGVDRSVDLLPVLHALAGWAEAHTTLPDGGGHMAIVHTTCGAETRSADTCTACGQRLRSQDVRWDKQWSGRRNVLVGPVDDPGE